MIFISILAFAAMAVASVSGFFSVWGLANTFHGIFWYVVAMGISLEVGKLVGSSYIYRFWTSGNRLLKGLMGVMIVVLMTITAVGHYGFLSSGYQQDALPLKQQTDQVALLQTERDRKQERKAQIDEQISTIMGETATARNRERLVKQYKEEQVETTARLNALDKEILAAKQTLLAVEAHVGPIIYIAQVFNVSADIATKWLVLLIVLVFDPMAVALTLALNHAIQDRQEQKDKKTHADDLVHPWDDIVDEPEFDKQPIVSQVVPGVNSPIYYSVVTEGPEVIPEVLPEPEAALEEKAEVVPDEELPPHSAVVSEPDQTFFPSSVLSSGSQKSPYEQVDNIEAKISEILDYRSTIMAKIRRGEHMTPVEARDLYHIDRLLVKHGYGSHVK